MRHLYAAATQPGVSYLIDKAKLFERRRCGHLPADYPEPLSAKECITSVVDPKGTQHNKHRYVIASQDIEVRKSMRQVMGVPLIYINRSVMIMEPMAEATGNLRDREEKGKFRDGLKGGRASGSAGMKRKRGEDGEETAEAGEATAKKKKVFGQPKGANPLSVKKAKKVVGGEGAAKKATRDDKSEKSQDGPSQADGAEGEGKRKRRRKHKGGAGDADGDGAAAAETTDVAESAVVDMEA